MAEFSKQYCERYQPEMKGDFDIDELLHDMPVGSYRAVICEGFGFHGLERDHEGRTFCLFGDEWARVPYVEIDDKTHLRFRNGE